VGAYLNDLRAARATGEKGGDSSLPPRKMGGEKSEMARPLSVGGTLEQNSPQKSETEEMGVSASRGKSRTPRVDFEARTGKGAVVHQARGIGGRGGVENLRTQQASQKGASTKIQLILGSRRESASVCKRWGRGETQAS